jgi:DNA topoisomerase IB
MSDYIIRKIKAIDNKKYFHEYYNSSKKKLSNNDYIDKVLVGTYIPPAYENVKIYIKKSSKVLAIGTDSKGRKQYIYNKDFVKN